MNTIKCNLNYTFLLVLVLSSYTLLGQIKTQGNANNVLTGENAFLDASGNVGNGNHFGKGIGFPTTDLTQWEFITKSADGINFPTTFDGLLVYNTGAGSTKADQGVVTPVEPGFYYFYNPKPAHDKDISKGKWLPVSKGGEAPAGGSLMSGAGAPSALTAPDSKAGDLYVDEETGEMYSRDDEKWIFHEETDDQKILKFAVEGTNLALSLEGDAIATRTVPLSDLGSVSSGAGAPAATAGSAGDVYVDENTGDLYTKDGDGWKKAGGGATTTGPGAPAPAPGGGGTTGEAGDIYVDESTGDTYIHNGDKWVKIEADGDAWAVDGEDTTSAISRTGNVGIGTAATAARLAVDPSGANPTVILGRAKGQPSIKSANELILDADDGSATYLNNHHNGDVSLANGGGNVGIGTNITPSKLTVNTPTNTGGFDFSDAAVSAFDPNHNGGDTPNGTKDILHLTRAGVPGESYSSKASFAVGRYEHSYPNSRSQLDIKLTDGNFNAHNTVMSLRSNGNVGVGTTTPTQRLDVDGGARIRTLTAGAAADEVVVADADGVLKTVARTSIGGSDGDAWAVDGEDTTGDISRTGKVGIGTGATIAQLTVNPSDANPTILLGRAADNESIKSNSELVLDAAPGLNVDLNYFNAGNVSLAFGGGDVGIGTFNPTYKLDVNGRARIRGFDPGAATDKVVVADADGVLKTVARTSIGGSDGDAWAVDGEDTTSAITRSGKVKIIGSLAPTSGGLEVGHSNLSQSLLFGYEGISKAGSKVDSNLSLNGKGIGHILLNNAATGNVGVGTNNPVSKLSVNGQTSGSSPFDFSDAAVSAFDPKHNGGNTPNGTKDILHLTRAGVPGESYSSKASFALGRYENVGTASRSQLDIKLTDGAFSVHNTVMSLRSNGRVGIGTANPIIDLAIGDTDTGLDQVSDGELTIKSNSTERVRISANGNVGIGTTAPVYKLDVNGGGIFRNGQGSTTFTGDQLRFGYVGSVDFSNAIRTRHHAGSDIGNAIDFYTWNHGTDAKGDSPTLHGMTITGGRVGIGGITAPTQRLEVNGNIASNEAVGRSDKRYKKNIQPITHALEKVTQMQGVYYHWNTDKFPEKDFSTDKTIGVIAQDIEKILPEVVTTDDTEEGYKAVNYAKLTAVLIEAIKEQQKQIEALQKEVHMLKH